MTETNEPKETELNKLKETKYLKIPNNWYDNLSISNEEFTLLIFLYRNYMQYKELALCSISLIATYLKYNTATNRNIIKTIKDIFISLVNKKEYITGLYDVFYNEISAEDIKDKDYLFYCKLVVPPSNNYFEILDKDIDSILDKIQGINLNKFNLIRYFCACRRVTNCEYHFGYLTQSKLKGLVNDSSTVQRYNNLLQDELHLIRYNNSYLTEDRHYCTTFIGTWEDEVSFTTNLKSEVERQGLIPTDKVVSNKKRSVKQKINNAELADKDKEIKELKAQLEALQYKPKQKVEPSDNNVDNIENSDADITTNNYPTEQWLDMPTEGEISKPKKSSLIKHIHSQDNNISNLIDDYVEETTVANPEANLVAKFLGNSAKAYKNEIDEIAEGSMSISFFFNGVCNHKDYSEYMKFKNNEMAIDDLM